MPLKRDALKIDALRQSLLENSMLSTPCILFAGGKSSRMGEDKALLPFGAFSTLTEYQYSRLSKIFLSVYISTKDPKKFHFPANFIVDSPSLQESYAPTAGFISAFETLSSERLFVLSVDTPFIGEYEINKLMEQDTPNSDATVAKTQQGVEAMCGIYHRSLLDSFRSMQQNNRHKLVDLLQKSKTNYLLFENEKAFLNLNYPDEYKEALLLVNN